jgi:hypothetical protein
MGETLEEVRIYRKDFLKLPNTKFHENLFSKSQFVTRRHQTEKNDTVKLTRVFLLFLKTAPIKLYLAPQYGNKCSYENVVQIKHSLPQTLDNAQYNCEDESFLRQYN